MKRLNQNILFITSIIISGWFFIGCGGAGRIGNSLTSISPSSSVESGQLITINGACYICTTSAVGDCVDRGADITSVTFSDPSATVQFTPPEIKNEGNETTYQIQYVVHGGPQAKIQSTVTCHTNYTDTDGQLATVKADVTIGIMAGKITFESIPAIISVGDVVTLRASVDPVPTSPLHVQFAPRNALFYGDIMSVADNGCIIPAGQNSCSTSLTVMSYNSIFSQVSLEAAALNYAPAVNDFSIANPAMNIALSKTTTFTNGSGTEANPYIGETNSNYSVSVNYTNNLSTTLTEFTTSALTTTNDWNITSHGCNSATLAAGGSCTDIYTINTAASGPHNLNLEQVKVSFKDDHRSYSNLAITGSNTVYTTLSSELSPTTSLVLSKINTFDAGTGAITSPYTGDINTNYTLSVTYTNTFDSELLEFKTKAFTASNGWSRTTNGCNLVTLAAKTGSCTDEYTLNSSAEGAHDLDLKLVTVQYIYKSKVWADQNVNGSNIEYALLTNSVPLITSIDLSSTATLPTGAGTLESPYIGNTSTTYTVSVSYTNKLPLSVTGFTTSDFTSLTGWQLTGHGCDNQTLTSGGACTDVYSINSGTAGTYDLSLASVNIAFTYEGKNYTEQKIPKFIYTTLEQSYDEFIYIVNESNVTMCGVNRNTYGLEVCNYTAQQSPMTTYKGIAVNKAKAMVYLTDPGIYRVYNCPITESGGFAECVPSKTTPNLFDNQYYGVAYNSTNSKLYLSAFAASYPISMRNTNISGIAESSGTLALAASAQYSRIAFTNDSVYGYYTNLADTVYKCLVDGNSGVLTGCATTGSDFTQPSSITVIANRAYITNSSANSVTVCSIVSGDLTGCTLSGAGVNALINQPIGISFTKDGLHAYIANAGQVSGMTITNPGSVIKCSVSAADGSLSSCSDSGVTNLIKVNGINIYSK